MCLADSRMFLPGLNLAYTDRSSMAASTEVRVPFVDVEVVRAAFAVPGGGKIVGRQGKVALKQAAEPRSCRGRSCYRPKASFSAPLRAWMRRDLRAAGRRGASTTASSSSPGFLRRDALRRLVAEDAAGQRGLLQADLAAADPRVLVPRRDLRVRPDARRA